MRSELTVLDLPAYLARVHLERSPAPSRAGVADLMVHHQGAIPFENLDVRLGRRIRLDLPSLERKLVAGGRGGYCFEQNTLFAAVLRSLGIEVAALEARVRPPGAEAPLPRTHMTLQAELDGTSWLVDVGFGGEAPMAPVPLSGAVAEDPAGSYRVIEEGGRVRVLQRRTEHGWSDLYSFAPEPALAVDFEVANHFTSTHPESVFVRNLTAQLSTPASRHVLRGRLYTRRGERPVQREDLGDDEIHALLTGTYSLRVDPDEVATALAGI